MSIDKPTPSLPQEENVKISSDISPRTDDKRTPSTQTSASKSKISFTGSFFQNEEIPSVHQLSSGLSKALELLGLTSHLKSNLGSYDEIDRFYRETRDQIFDRLKELNYAMLVGKNTRPGVFKEASQEIKILEHCLIRPGIAHEPATKTADEPEKPAYRS